MENYETSSGYIGYENSSGYIGHMLHPSIEIYFSDKNVNMISNKITQLLIGVHPDNLNIIVPNRTIRTVLYNIYNNNKWNVVDMTDQAIEVIYNQIKDEYDTIKKNNKLDKWDVYFDSTKGIRQHPPIKLKERRCAPMQFPEYRY